MLYRVIIVDVGKWSCYYACAESDVTNILYRYAEVSQIANGRYLEALSVSSQKSMVTYKFSSNISICCGEQLPQPSGRG